MMVSRYLSYVRNYNILFTGGHIGYIFPLTFLTISWFKKLFTQLTKRKMLKLQSPPNYCTTSRHIGVGSTQICVLGLCNSCVVVVCISRP
jgi:hypothetical protein